MTHEHTADYIDRYHFPRIFADRNNHNVTVFANGHVFDNAERRKCARNSIKRMKAHRDSRKNTI